MALSVATGGPVASWAASRACRHHGGIRTPVPQDGEPLDTDQELAQVVLGR
jgi:hypothetical protein